MWTQSVRVLQDTAPAAWIGPRLRGAMGTVAGTVPAEFEAYARILHPVERSDGGRELVSWARVAQVTGRQVHPTVQWHALIGSADPYAQESDLWPHGAPEQGNLLPAPLLALCALLTPRTTTPQDCLFALWEGWGSHNGGSTRITLFDDGTSRSEPVPPLFNSQERAAPKLRLPGRDYHLLGGPLTAMQDLVQYEPSQPAWTQSPSLFWPADRAWCVATEIDFDSTLVGGSAATIDAVLASPALEAWRVQEGDSLMADADQINRT